MLSSKKIRQMWIDFFVSKNHFLVESKSLIPHNDPSLLWINSGVATLKDFFSGKKTPPQPKLVNSQKAIRTNDIENVGVTSRHHTMFEMLGNFSIGDYFKNEAIELADEFLLKVLCLEKSKLYITYFEEDEFTKDKWLSLGYLPEQLIPGSRKTNFWDMGQGPCGPCSEIFYDRGLKYDLRGIELLKNDIENDRYIEIWNIVFSQFNNDGENNYTELAQKNIDTGAGLERIVSILQDAPTNFDTDLFLPIIREIEKQSKYKYVPENYFIKDPQQTQINIYFKVIADHIRAVVNAINDGAVPSNVSRGYIIRRLIRRAYRSGIKLGIETKTFLHTLVQVVKDSLIFDIDVPKVAKIIEEEEFLFSQTIDQGHKLLAKEIENLQSQFDFAIAFKMYETYGFPIELTQEILKEKGIELDISLFEEYKEKHASASRSNKKTVMEKAINSLAGIKEKISAFIGYHNLTSTSKVIFLANEETRLTNHIGKSFIILDKTPFYATSGGQKHDQGYMLQAGNKLIVKNVFKDKHGNHVHLIEGKVNSHDLIKCFVNEENRVKLEINHSSTHLLFKSLRVQFGNGIEQLGSDNNENRLTFDFPIDQKPNEKVIAEIEQRVKSYISAAAKRNYLETTINKAREMNAIMTLEDTEYADANNVRLVEFENITLDLCGGTHISNSKKIENFKIIALENKGLGIFRIRAITTNVLVNQYLSEKIVELEEQLQTIIAKNQAFDEGYNLKIEQNEDKEKMIVTLNAAIEKARNDNKKIVKEQQKVAINENIVFEKIKNYDVYISLSENPANIKILGAELREKYPQAIFVLGNKAAKPMLLIASRKVDSKELLKNIFAKTNGRGGGSAIIAQGSYELCEDIEKLIRETILCLE